MGITIYSRNIIALVARKSNISRTPKMSVKITKYDNLTYILGMLNFCAIILKAKCPFFSQIADNRTKMSAICKKIH